MGILDRFSALFPERLQRDPPGFNSNAETDDAQDMLVAETMRVPQRGVSGLRIGIDYQSADGSLSQRVVHMKGIHQGRGGNYFTAHCELRNSARSFRIDRVLEVVDYRTGEVFTEPDVFFRPLLDFAQMKGSGTGTGAVPDATDHLISACIDGLCVLLYFATADGVVLQSERRVIGDYVDRHVASAKLSSGFNRQYLDQYTNATVPDREDFEAALERLLVAGDGRAEKAIEAARELVISDGVADVEEVARLEALEKIVSEYR